VIINDIDPDFRSWKPPMKPARFRYYRASDARDAAEQLRVHGTPGKACALAGGQSLVPALAAREQRPDLIVDIMGCADLRDISVSEGRLRIGAACRQFEVETSRTVADACPLVGDALRWVAMPQVRSRGTVVGSLIQANAGGEMPVVARTLDADLIVLDDSGEASKIDAGRLYAVASGTTLPPLTLAVGVEFPVLGKHDLWAFEEIQLRPGHVAIVCVAVVLHVRDGQVHSARIGIGGLTSNPYRATAAEAFLKGVNLEDCETAFATAAATAVGERPWPSRADLHASDRYREAAARTVIRNTLARAALRHTSIKGD
jgi:CO/xanthine dehydrogenase FAD-binding subunit